MNSKDYIPWVEKYRPKKLDEIVQTENLINLFQNNIRTREMPHYLFYGSSGTGKTTSILTIGREIFKEFFPSRVIEFNASDDRGINAVREKISSEAKKYVNEMTSSDGTIIPPYKIIILDEADTMTDEAQDALRVIIEQYSSVTRFCFICNYISKITDAIKSRCSAIYFKRLDRNSMILKLSEISEKEKMEISEEILNTIIEVSNEDMRKAIMLLQNLKYLYDYQKRNSTSISDIPVNQIKYLSFCSYQTITKYDIYKMAGFISLKEASKIVKKILKCKNIQQIMNLSKEIISMGYPVDNIIFQINKYLLQSDKLTCKERAKVIIYSGKIFYNMKNCADESIHLVDYLSCIYGVKNGLSLYSK
jgi:replication factor C subunit 2/4